MAGFLAGDSTDDLLVILKQYWYELGETNFVFAYVTGAVVDYHVD